MKLSHTAIYVFDLDLTKSFYMNVFGFKLKYEGEADDRLFCFLVLNNQMVELVKNENNKYRKTDSIAHLSYLVEDLSYICKKCIKKMELSLEWKKQRLFLDIKFFSLQD